MTRSSSLSPSSKPCPNYIAVSYMDFVLPFLSILGEILIQVVLLQSYPYYLHPCSPWSHPHFLEGPLSYIQKLFLTSAIVSVCWTLPNYLKQVSLFLSLINATFKCSQIHSILILSFLILPHIYLNIVIIATLIFRMCFFIIGLLLSHA